MGLNYQARVIYGFILEEKPVEKTIKKFNENTGEPYEATEHSHDKVCVNDVDVLDHPDKTIYDLDGFDGMEIIRSGYEQGTMLLGTVIGKADDDGPVTQLNVEQEFRAVKDFAAAHGITPKFYVVQSC